MKEVFRFSDYTEEIKQTNQSDLSLRNKYIQLKRILERNCKEITASESLQFPSLFSRIVFIAQKYELPKSLEWELQNIRIKTNFLLRSEQNIVSPGSYKQAREALENFLSFIEGTNVHFNYVEDTLLDENRESTPNHIDRIRVQVISIDKELKIVRCKSDTFADKTLEVRYGIETVNDSFDTTIDRIWIGAQMNLIDVKTDNEGCLIPKIFVLEPDYLIDASAMAECFQNYGNSHLHYFRRKFEPNANSKHILLGNLANFFLDELVYANDPENLTFNEIFLKSFLSMPFEYTSCNDIKENIDFKDFMAKAEMQFNNIKRVVRHDMPINGFDVSACTLEPSFFCEKYGFQGRLDLLQLSDEENGIDRIIELKSGKPPYPREDVTKIAPNHETQTAIYRLMIQSVFGKDSRRIYPTILYSAAENEGENIRFAAIYQKLEKEIINIRNLIVATEHDLYTGNEESVKTIFEELFNLDNYGNCPQFFIDKLDEIKKVIDDASDIEIAYFFRFINFISRELYLQKAGDENNDSYMSISALWNTAFEERKNALDLISDLEIESIDDSGRDMIIRFRRNTITDSVNFREGEICILYPCDNSSQSVLTNQILKGAIVEISTKSVIIRFRYKQRNRNFFAQYRSWAVEHDKLDHSYNAMFKSLFVLLSAPKEKKNLLLGLKQPTSTYYKAEVKNPTKEEKYKIVLEKAIAAQDYFLIVGPPGTGKTSIFAKELIKRFYSDESCNILVIAYTNRAVDELCTSICTAFEEDDNACNKYIRIGTELSCKDNYRHRLLQNISNKATNRKELIQEINKTRIFIGTLASITGKSELFDLKSFNIAIIDEASQILEPQIIGLLSNFDKFIMIGDHKQLSTITLQNKNKSNVEAERLNSIGLFDCRESLFERLYNINKKNGNAHIYETLSYHGRMHKEIASLVNPIFYNNELVEATERQKKKLLFQVYDKVNKIQEQISLNRILFIRSKGEKENIYWDKTNENEAKLTIELVEQIYEVYKLNNKVFDCEKSVGIITPYRNQIALIKQKLEETGISELQKIMVDTVERFQGSQRDIIIISFCFNKAYQVEHFCNMNREGTVDRKLNVALTRAREQLFMIGNEELLQLNPIYRNILERVKHIEIQQ